jgi:NADH-quinone oxidoreductase subunit N
VDQIGLVPAYCAAGTALLPFLADLLAPGRRGLVAGSAALGAAATGTAAVLVAQGPVRTAFCAPDGLACSYVTDQRSAVFATAFAALTLVVIALSAAMDRPAEYYFLLGCSMTGGVVLASTGDLILLIVAVETLTLPLYPLAGLRSRDRASAEGAVTFFVVSVVSTAVTLLGAALLYASTGALHFDRLADALFHAPRTPLVAAGAVLLVAGLGFKIAAVPFHAWAPSTYDGAPVPVAAYLSTASKLGGVVAILYLVMFAFNPVLDLVGPALAALSALTMTVGNLGALRQTRMVRLLAWSSVAQAGYLLAPLGALALARGRTSDGFSGAVVATVGYTLFYVILELGAFGAVVALRGTDDGGRISDYRGAARRSPWATGVFTLAVIGLAGLPPGLAGLFAKVVVVRSLLSGGSAWLAIVVAVNTVLGLAYYVPAVATLFAPGDAAHGDGTVRRLPPWQVTAALGAVTAAGVLVGFAPQWVLDGARHVSIGFAVLVRQ